MKYLILIPFLICFVSCKQEKKQLSAQEIIDKTIENAGGELYENAEIQFGFRDVKYSSIRKNGFYELNRSFTDSLGTVKDVLNNSGFNRFRNGEKIDLPDSTATKYANSVNSVHYFVQLPYGLNASSVKKILVGEVEIEDEKYFKIKVTFEEDGGGSDHDDIYMYWINQKDFTIDYFAYKFYTGEGGIRFRKVFNPRTIEGLRFVDYQNYKLEPWESVDLKTIDKMYESGKLQLLSEIKTEDISVKITRIE